MKSTYLDRKDIIKYLRNEVFELYFDDGSINWKEATQIPIDYAKFYSYPAEGIYDVELLLKVKKVTSKFEAIFCYFIDLDNEENIFSIPFFKNWKKDIPKDEVLSYEQKRCFMPLINNDTTIEDINLGTQLQITLGKNNNSQYLKLVSCELK